MLQEHSRSPHSLLSSSRSPEPSPSSSSLPANDPNPCRRSGHILQFAAQFFLPQIHRDGKGQCLQAGLDVQLHDFLCLNRNAIEPDIDPAGRIEQKLDLPCHGSIELTTEKGCGISLVRTRSAHLAAVPA